MGLNTSVEEACKGKVVWVVGASSGIGESLAVKYFDKGSKVILSARRVEKLENLKKRLEGEDEANGKGRVAVLPMDVSDLDSAEKYVQDALTIFEKIDVVVLNAGISNRGSVLRTEFAVHERVMKVNYFGPVALTKAILPHFIQQGGGHFIVISSVQGKLAVPMRSPYSASKHAVQGFFESLRYEIAHENIKVLTVCPGYIKTELSMNALTTDVAKKHNTMDANTKKGFEPSYLADKVLQAMANEDDEIVVAQTTANLALTLKKYFPGLLSTILKRKGGEEMKAEAEAQTQAEE